MKDVLTGQSPSEAIFRIIDSAVDEHGLSPEESRATVAEIIGVLKSKNITYGCAAKLLEATFATLNEMKHLLQL